MRLKPLERGDVIRLVAPSSPVDEDLVREGVEMLEDKGFRVVVSSRAFQRRGYLAGEDENRAADLNEALSSDEVAAVMMARGGYGLLRIMDRIDFSSLVSKPKLLVGFSDASSLLCYVSTRLGIPTIHGCMPATSQMRSSASCRLHDLIELLTGGFSLPYSIGEGLLPVDRGEEVEGKVAGGCLSVLVSLFGTPFEPDFDGKILVLEEVREKAYRVDRMMSQLRISGKLERAACLVMGRFVPVEGESTDHLEEIVAEACAAAGIPVFRGVQVGHEGENVPFPLGVAGKVVREPGGFSLKVVESHFEVEWT